MGDYEKVEVEAINIPINEKGIPLKVKSVKKVRKGNKVTYVPCPTCNSEDEEKDNG